MATDNLSNSFGNEPKEPELMNPATYEATLRKLLAEGTGWGKTQTVGAFELVGLKLETETKTGLTETVKDVQTEELYLVFDIAPDQWPNHEARKMAVKDTTEKYGQRIVRERDLDSPDFKGPGFWTVKKGGLAKLNGFEYDYLKQDPSNDDCSVYAPNPDAVRVCLQVDEDVKIPVTWGDFVVEAGGTLAIREAHVKELAEALDSISFGQATAEEALYNEDGTAKFDIYGQEPGFCQSNYDPVELKDDTKLVQVGFIVPEPPTPLPDAQP